MHTHVWRERDGEKERVCVCYRQTDRQTERKTYKQNERDENEKELK